MSTDEALDIADYAPVDTLYLWWLAQPDRPRWIGSLMTVRSVRGVSLRYADGWLQAGFPLSEDLPLVDLEFLPREKDTAAGAVDDARPDRWGERVVKQLYKPPRLSLMEYLFYAGPDRFGALGVSTSPDRYLPCSRGPLPRMQDVEALDRLVRQVLRGEPVPRDQERLLAPGGTLGGARPKALLDMDGHEWVLKFAEEGEPVDTPLVEHATMTLAATAGIRVAETRPVPVRRGHAVAVRRFDRDGTLRRHALSANVVLKAGDQAMGYPEMAQFLRRRGPADAAVRRDQMHELFRRMVFNILMDNTDDHEKNHVFLMTDRGDFELSPAFDVLPSGQALGYQQMTVGDDGADATLANAMSRHAQFRLSAAEARDHLRRVVQAVDGWQGHFAQAGVSAADIASLSRQIDRPFLKHQRATF
jgi:serine/threonine-protein kinase HipA